MNRGIWRDVAVSGSIGVAWVVVVAVNALLGLAPSNGLRALGGAVLPAGVTPFMWSWPVGWAITFVLVGAVALALAHAALTALFRRGGDATTAGLWLVAVAAGALVGLTVDATLVFGTLFTQGWAMWALDLGSRAAVGAYFGLLYGWVPALIAHLLRRRAAATPRVQATPQTHGRAALLVVAAVAALILVGAVDTAGDDAAQRTLQAEAAAQNPEPDGAQYPDPSTPGDPVPTQAPGDGSTGPDACTADVSMLLLGGTDAATGHRVQDIRLMNFSDDTCVIEGYPDVAFGDQNAHELAVTITHGGGFLAVDPGAAPVELPPGGEAVAHLTWDAQSTQGALVARTLWAATLPGDVRGSWPIEADIVEGTVVSVTAWEFTDAPITGTDG